MNDKLRRCPNCGAYVMGDDDRCPRCDVVLNAAAESGDETSFDGDTTEIIPAPEAALAPVPQEADAGVKDDDHDTGGDDAIAPDVDTGDETEDEATDELAAADPTPDATESLDAAEAPETAAPVSDADGVDAATAADAKADAPEEAAEDEAANAVAEGAAASAADTDPGIDVSPPDMADQPTHGFEGAEREAEPESAPDDTQDTPTSATPPDLHATQPGSTQLPESAPEAVEPHAGDEPEPPGYIVPPAPFTPPPVPPAPPTYIPPGYTYAPAQPANANAAIAYLQQRVAAYRHAGYRLLAHSQYEAALSQGKTLGVGGWILGLLTGIGALWYLLLLATSGFRQDDVFVALENDGRVYEDGPGAAHVRLSRTRTGQRWAAFGLIVFFVSLMTAILLGLIAGVVLTQDRYQAALREAYPAVTLFEENFSADEAQPDDVQLAEDGAVVFAVMSVLTAVGLWGGATLFVIGTIHASAYRVRVPPLPGWA